MTPTEVRFILFNYTTMSYPTYSDLELEIQNLEEENKKLNENIKWYEEEEDRLRKENRILKSAVEWYQEHYWPKPITTIEELQNHKWNTIWM